VLYIHRKNKLLMESITKIRNEKKRLILEYRIRLNVRKRQLCIIDILSLCNEYKNFYDDLLNNNI